ncbi:dentin sialophosphoprotein [Hordeum vulgare subsp. vulgare]|uniref:Predicted protein n=1 Tax=Hordeum vulgare subsp. vulgare TaxID=112509 RepID=F2D6E5_HORVV|nr:dentin sialophosphoprotein [Hordeum vulgare subsp. vulgare]BAJ90666.1 predicted protein [Hordeum vulgare subsp. vulgare]
MYKLGGGRGAGRGGGGGAKRPPASHGRGRGASSSSMGKGPPPRGRAALAAAAAASAAAAAQAAGREESFSLESSGPPAFAAIIRLTPDLVDEIRRAEEAGGGARIMFNSSINPAENVIDVDGKEFNFAWASERGELCDIYEEQQSGEGGNGLLVERGSAWRKVTVDRTLDESAKNLVKARSEEAERLAKSRKSIVLDPGNPSVRNQAKSMVAAGEGNMRRGKWNQKKDNFNKKQATVIPTKSISKVKLPNSIPKGNISTSPAPSPEQPGPSLPSFLFESDANNEVIVPFDLNKEENSKFEKATPNRISRGLNHRASSVSASVDDNTTDVRSLLISILSENPKGMNLKALEKAVADAIPNASKKIEHIVKNVADYQSSGRYLLKPELEVENSNHASGSGRTIDENIEEIAPSLRIDDPDIFEKIEIGGSPVSAAGDEKVHDSDAKAGTSSESGSDSDSDSDSSGSGSDSGSQSRSAGSGSGSSSDSDSDASSSSKEGSDAFVDITSDDNKPDTACRKVADELKLSSSPVDFPAFDGDDEQIDIGTNLDYKSASSHIDLNNLNVDNDEPAYAGTATEKFGASNVDMPSEFPGRENMVSTRLDQSIVDGKYPASNKISYEDNHFDDPLAASSENLPNEEAIQFTEQHDSRRNSASKDGTNHAPTRISEKGAKPTLKRFPGNENAITKPESAKKAKVDTAYPGATGSLSAQRQNLPPDKHLNERSGMETGNVGWDTHTDLQVQDSSPMKGRPVTPGDLQKINQGQNVPIPTIHSEGKQEKITKTSSKKKLDKVQKPLNSMDGSLGNVNFDDTDDSAARKRGRHGGSSLDGKKHKRSKDPNIDANPMNLTKGVKGNVNHNMMMPLPECTETNGKPPILQRNSAEKSSPKKVLQREHSDLELGELREGPLENDNGRTRKQFERNSSSKSLDGKATNVDNFYPSMNSRKVALSASHDQRRPSPQELNTRGNINLEGFPRKTAGYDFDNNRSQHRGNVSQGRQLPRTDDSDSENILYPDRSMEKTGKRETKMTQGGMLDHVDSKKTTPKLPQNGTKNGIESRTRKSMSPAENEERSRNTSLIETETGRKRRDSSSEEDNLFFKKYDKAKPELKGPIKDFSQYEDYLQEYNEKYKVYSYLNSQIEKTQSEFLKVQEDLNVAKERDKDKYYNMVERLREMYHESGTRHKLMKKVFVLLHEELQSTKQRINDFAKAYSNE